MSCAAAVGKAIEEERSGPDTRWCSQRSALTVSHAVSALTYPAIVRTVVLGPPPAEISALIARRHALGLDTHDEVWQGEYHLAPAVDVAHGWVDQQLAQLLAPLAAAAGLVATGPFNLGSPDDFRVPDRALHRGRPTGAFLPTAALVVEILSPHDETWEKFGFYAAHEVDEILVASPADRSLSWWVLDGARYVAADQSTLLGPESAHLADRIDWPPRNSVAAPAVGATNLAGGKALAACRLGATSPAGESLDGEVDAGSLLRGQRSAQAGVGAVGVAGGGRVLGRCHLNRPWAGWVDRDRVVRGGDGVPQHGGQGS